MPAKRKRPESEPETKPKPKPKAVAKAKPKQKTIRELDDDILDLIGKSGLADPKGEFAELRRDHAAGPLDVKTLLYRQDFARALTTWMKNMKYQIGLNPKDFTGGEEVKWAKHLASIGTKLLSVHMPIFISSGATSDETFPVLVPFIPLADLVCFQVRLGMPNLGLVIFADGVPLEELLGRFEKFLELAKPLAQFGVRLNGNSTSPALVWPLLVYFDETEYQNAKKEIMAHGRVTKMWDHLNLHAGAVNVPRQEVIWPEAQGVLASFGSWLTKVTGGKPFPFEPSDLQSVITLAGRSS